MFSELKKFSRPITIGLICVFSVILVGWILPPILWPGGIGIGKDDSVTTTTVETFEKDKQGKTVKKVTTTAHNDGKTLWDWGSLLGVPLSLAILGYVLQQEQQRRAEKLSEEQRKIADNEIREKVLQAYFDRLSALLINRNLIARSCKYPPDYPNLLTPGEKELLDSSRNIIRARTLSILRRFEKDAERKTSVIKFLIDTEIVGKLKLNLSGADFSGADLFWADLSGANLSGANLQRTNLEGANLHQANLQQANLFEANLQRAKLLGADLKGANLQQARLQGVNLCDANLCDANLSGVDLSGVDLSEAFLYGANLQGANLSGAKLSFAFLSGANLCEAFLFRTGFWKADFSMTDLSGVDLSEAFLAEANLERTNLYGANLYGVNLQGARLEGACLAEANLQRANLDGADLQGARLHGANLQQANLQRANLQGAGLEGANLFEANLQRAYLDGANLYGANLNGANLENIKWNSKIVCKCNSETVWPDKSAFIDAQNIPEDLKKELGITP